MMKIVFCLFASLLLLSGCGQNTEAVSSNERLEDSPRPVVDPKARPLAMPGGSDKKMEVPPFVKIYFMQMWVEALYSTPKNKHPNPKWESPLADPVNSRVWCTDCHMDSDVDFTKLQKIRLPLVDQYENDKTFMVDLMKKWVARLNSSDFGAKARLKGPVTCLTCHATNPELEN